jgi:hypothetical protein
MRLFLDAFRLAGHAQEVARAPLPDVASRLLALGGLPRGADPDAAWVAAARGCRYRCRWRGALDTCLVRALVAGTLVADRDGVVLHVGFRPAPSGVARLDGHAWVSVNDQAWGLPAASLGESYDAALDLRLHRLEDKG